MEVQGMVGPSPVIQVRLSHRIERRDRSLEIVLRCFASSVGADRALVLRRSSELSPRVGATWTREGRPPAVSWTEGSLLGRVMSEGGALLEPGIGDEGGQAALAAAVRSANDEVVGAIYCGFEPASSLPEEELLWSARCYAAVAAVCMSDDPALPAALGSVGVDGLTGCLSYEGMFELLQAEFLRSQRGDHELALCMLDIDDFKRINDTLGHVEGNRVLAAVGDGLRATARRYDAVGRFGGDEFVIALPETAGAEAGRAAERFRRGAHEAVFEATGIELDLSVGVVGWDRESSVSALIDAADELMREAKARGGGQVRSRPNPGGRRLDGLARLTRQLIRPWASEDGAAAATRRD